MGWLMSPTHTHTRSRHARACAHLCVTPTACLLKTMSMKCDHCPTKSFMLSPYIYLPHIKWISRKERESLVQGYILHSTQCMLGKVVPFIWKLGNECAYCTFIWKQGNEYNYMFVVHNNIIMLWFTDVSGLLIATITLPPCLGVLRHWFSTCPASISSSSPRLVWKWLLLSNQQAPSLVRST